MSLQTVPSALLPTRRYTYLTVLPKQNKFDPNRLVASADGGRNVPRTRRELARRAPNNGLIITKVLKRKIIHS